MSCECDVNVVKHLCEVLCVKCVEHECSEFILLIMKLYISWKFSHILVIKVYQIFPMISCLLCNLKLI